MKINFPQFKFFAFPQKASGRALMGCFKNCHFMFKQNHCSLHSVTRQKMKKSIKHKIISLKKLNERIIKERIVALNYLPLDVFLPFSIILLNEFKLQLNKLLGRNVIIQIFCRRLLGSMEKPEDCSSAQSVSIS